MIARAAVSVVLAGAAATALTAAVVDMAPVHAAQLFGLAALAALASGALGGAAIRAARRRAVGVQAALTALTAVAAVATGAVLAARAMFLSRHDLGVLLVVTVAGATAGTVLALVLGHRVRVGSGALGEAARSIGAGDGPPRLGEPATRELAGLARELEDMSARLAEARARERALETSRRDLVAWVSHDLRTPLAGIRAMAEALEDRVAADSETVARYHRTMRQEADRLAALVDDLFELARIHAGALRLELERVPLADLVSDALAAADPLARARGVRLESRLPAAAPELKLSAQEVARVLRNLLENAIRHTPSDGTVLVELATAGEDAVVAVEDECGGIPESDIGRVFEPAFRGEPARTPGGGAGLGLAIARGIVEAHRGRIEVRNAGAGCRFTVRLPLRPA